MVLLSSSCCPFSFCTFLSVRELFTGTFTIWLLTTSSSSHYFSIRSRELATCFFSAWYRLFGRDTASSFLLPLSEILWFVLLAIFMTPVYFATKAHTLGIMTPMHQVQSETTTKDDSCPEYLPFSQPVSQPVLAEMGEKKIRKRDKRKLCCRGLEVFTCWHFWGWQPALIHHAALQEVAFQYRASQKDRKGRQQSWWPTLGRVLSQENLWRHRHSYCRLFLLCLFSRFVIMLQLWNWALFQPGSPWQWTGERRLLLSYQTHCVHGKKMCEELKLYGCTGSLLWW